MTPAPALEGRIGLAVVDDDVGDRGCAYGVIGVRAAPVEQLEVLRAASAPLESRPCGAADDCSPHWFLSPRICTCCLSVWQIWFFRIRSTPSSRLACPAARKTVHAIRTCATFSPYPRRVRRACRPRHTRAALRADGVLGPRSGCVQDGLVRSNSGTTWQGGLTCRHGNSSSRFWNAAGFRTPTAEGCMNTNAKLVSTCIFGKFSGSAEILSICVCSTMAMDILRPKSRIGSVVMKPMQWLASYFTRLSGTGGGNIRSVELGLECWVTSFGL